MQLSSSQLTSSSHLVTSVHSIPDYVSTQATPPAPLIRRQETPPRHLLHVPERYESHALMIFFTLCLFAALDWISECLFPLSPCLSAYCTWVSRSGAPTPAGRLVKQGASPHCLCSDQQPLQPGWGNKALCYFEKGPWYSAWKHAKIDLLQLSSY